jgi:predicted phosphodiesterase
MESRSSDMRVAVISDIHGNLTAFEAVLADLRQSSPDVTLHGGDLAGIESNRDH